MKPTAVLLLAYGTPNGPEEIEAYYTDIRGGRPPTPEGLAELRARYERVGGRTPLLDITRRVAEGLQLRLGAGYRVHVGMRHWHPFIAAAVAEIGAEGAEHLVAIPLTPHYSRVGAGGYRQIVTAALARLPAPPRLSFIERWHDHPEFRRLMAERIRVALEGFPPEAAGQVRLIFSAHSLPERIRAWDDPYPRELRESAAAIARLVGSGDWEFAYQSAGRTPEPWLGPDLLSTIERLAGEGRRYLLSVPFGFTCDHLEVLFDLDVEAQELARRLGVTLRRTEMLNADPRYVALLEDLVRRAAP